MADTSEKKSKLILSGNPIWKGIISLSIPIFLVNVVKTLHDMVDAVFLGRIPDIAKATQMQSAIALVWPIFFIFLSFGIGLSVAGNGLIGQYVGKKDLKNAKKYANNVIYLSLFLGILFNIIAYFIGPLILQLMNASGDELGYAITYLRIRSFGLPILFLSFGFQAIRRATGDTLTPVYISAFSIVVNIILTPIFILVLDMGITGAGLSTLIANALMIPGIIYFLLKAKNGLKTDFSIKSVNFNILKDLFNIIIPASLGQSIQAIGFVILNAQIRSFGEQVMAAFYIGNRINSLVMFPILSFSAIVTIYVAQNIGAGNIPRAKKSIKQGIIISLSFMIIGALIIVPLRLYIAKFFSQDPETVKFAMQYALYVGLGLPLMAIFQNFLAVFQGSGETKYTFVLAVARLWAFRLPLVFLFMSFTDLGPSGIWYAMLISNALASVVGYFLYKRVKFIPKTRANLEET